MTRDKICEQTSQRIFTGYIGDRAVHITKVHWSRYSEGRALANAWQKSTKGAGRWECTIEYREVEAEDE